MRHRFLFHRIWLLLGLAQLALAAGCHAGAASDWLLTSTSPSSEETQGSSEDPGSHEALPPARVSRAFFEKPLVGTLHDGNHAALSRVSWQESSPAEPPTSGNHEGCAVFQDAGGAMVCFNVVNDVTSISLDPSSVDVQELCEGGGFQSAKVVNSPASREATAVVISALCDGRPMTAELSRAPSSSGQ
jgi:hypothetical protein